MATNNAVNKPSLVNTYAFAGNPNGSVAGALNDFCINTSSGTLYYCSTAGNAASAVWTVFGGGSGGSGALFNFQQTALTLLYSYSLSAGFGWVNTALSVSITPTSASNQVLVTGVAYLSSATSQMIGLAINRNGVQVGIGTAGTSAFKATTVTDFSGSQLVPQPFRFLDTPATTSPLTYTIQAYSSVSPSSVTMWLNQFGNDPGSSTSFGECISVIDVCEVQG